ncbi:MAG: DUF1917 domain-containing protein [Pleurocapsa minor GSE-CHR-MK-17-07R]|jgi:hypothetical protein|nr:DUF1917 domain-containing protein [Pleurocapsa minor GSE-CHR-MK 17-07R]
MTEPKGDKIDLSLIQMVQRARMAHDAEALPSQMEGVYWIEYKPEVPVAPPTSRAGVFVIETDAVQADALWAAVKEATRTGALGYKSKVTTASRSRGKDRDDRLVHVLTADADDAADVARVRAALDALGITASFRRVNG